MALRDSKGRFRKPRTVKSQIRRAKSGPRRAVRRVKRAFVR